MRHHIAHGSRVMFTQAWRDTYGIDTGWMCHEQGTVLKTIPCGTATIAHVEWDNGCQMFILTSNLVNIAKQGLIAA